MVGIRFGGGRDELLTFMQCLGVITPPYSIRLLQVPSILRYLQNALLVFYPKQEFSLVCETMGTMTD